MKLPKNVFNLDAPKRSLECRRYIDGHLAELGAVAEDGYVKTGRGAVVVHFQTANEAATFTYCPRMQISASLVSGSTFRDKLRACIGAYEPDNQAVVMIFFDKKLLSIGVIQFLR